MYSSAAAQEGSTLPCACRGAGERRVIAAAGRGSGKECSVGVAPTSCQEGAGRGALGSRGGGVCAPAGGSGSLPPWPGRSTSGVLGSVRVRASVDLVQGPSGDTGWESREGRPGGPGEAALKPRAPRRAGGKSPRGAPGRRAGASPRLRGAREDAGQRGQRRGRLAGALESVDEDAGHQRSLQGRRRRAGPAVQIQCGAGIQVGN